MTGSAVASWPDGKTTCFLMFSLPAHLRVIGGVVFFLHAAELGAGMLAFGIPMLLAVVFSVLRPGRKWL